MVIFLAAITALAAVAIGLRLVKRQFDLKLREASERRAARDRSREERFMKRFKPPDEQATAHLTWEAEGEKRFAGASVLDVSEEGARIKSAVPLPMDLPVVIQMPATRLAGTARVRYCEKDKSAYYVGLEFKGPLFRTL
jgi:hypothetical protein